METKQSRNWALGGTGVVIAVAVALFSLSGALGTEPQAQAVVQESGASAYQDPSLAGLSVADDAEPDSTFEYAN